MSHYDEHEEDRGAGLLKAVTSSMWGFVEELGMWQDNEAKKESRTKRHERSIKDIMKHRHTDTLLMENALPGINLTSKIGKILSVPVLQSAAPKKPFW